MLGSWQSPTLPLWRVLGFWGAITLVGILMIVGAGLIVLRRA
jgi:hypothetical protein